jgi:hypothetical protein
VGGRRLHRLPPALEEVLDTNASSSEMSIRYPKKQANLANTLRSPGEFGDAEESLDSVLDIQRRRLGEDHPTPSIRRSI